MTKFLVVLEVSVTGGRKPTAQIFPLRLKGGGGFDTAEVGPFLEGLWAEIDFVGGRGMLDVRVVPSIDARAEKSLACDYTRECLRAEVRAAMGGAPPVRGDGGRREKKDEKRS